MKVSDLIVKIFEEWSFQDVFIVSGGGSMHLNDSFGRSKKIQTIPLHHEQSCSMAADGYFRACNKPALVNVTTGPGGMNALNGVYGAFVDSIPMIVISGQIKTEHLVKNINADLRQFGDQEAKITDMVKHITKHAVLIESKRDLINKINKCIEIAITGRKGPVWIDLPLDIQASYTNISLQDIKNLTKKYKNNLTEKQFNLTKKHNKKIVNLVNLINKSSRPLIIAGNGVRFSNNLKEFHAFVKRLKIPVCTVWNSHDILTNDSPFYAGRPGADGERAGNFNMQNSDLLIIIGARMHVRQIGFDDLSFARKAKKVMIDIDKAELDKPNLRIDHKINIHLDNFFQQFKELEKSLYANNISHKVYLDWCRKNVNELEVVEKKHLKSKKGAINPYHFVSVLFDNLSKNTNIITGDGTAAVVTFKAAKLFNNQRLFTNKGCASMGYDLPALIGSLYSDPKNKKGHILITGDGSIMMNLQELSSLRKFKDRNIKIFILNNEGYHSIRQSQFNYFNGFEVGCGEDSNLFMPNFRKIAKAFSYNYFKVNSKRTLQTALIKNDDSIKIIEVMIDKEQVFEPRVSATKLPNGKMVSSPLEEMSPLMPKKDFLKRMIIPLAKNSNYKND
jgi:acetolactate synthase-1/2/3 large subunit